MRAEVENAGEAFAKNALEHLLVKLEGTVWYLEAVKSIRGELTNAEELILELAKKDLEFVPNTLLK